MLLIRVVIVSLVLIKYYITVCMLRKKIMKGSHYTLPYTNHCMMNTEQKVNVTSDNPILPKFRIISIQLNPFSRLNCNNNCRTEATPPVMSKSTPVMENPFTDCLSMLYFTCGIYLIKDIEIFNRNSLLQYCRVLSLFQPPVIQLLWRNWTVNIKNILNDNRQILWYTGFIRLYLS